MPHQTPEVERSRMRRCEHCGAEDWVAESARPLPSLYLFFEVGRSPRLYRCRRCAHVMTTSEWIPASRSDLPARFTVRQYVRPPGAVWRLQWEGELVVVYDPARGTYEVLL
mgnify:CR=1 FL=1